MLGNLTKPPFTGRIGLQGRQESAFVQGRPERIGKKQLGIGHLPDQEVADPLLATRADQEIRVGDVALGQGTRKGGFGELDALLCQAASCLNHIPTAAVVETDIQHQ